MKNRRDVLVAAAVLAPLALSATALAQAARAPSARSAAVSDVVDELKALLQAQAKQWSAGDLEGFCAHYAEDCLFLSPGGPTRGRKDVLDRYKKKYVDKAAMGTLTLEVLDASTSDTMASVAMAWMLSYTDRGKLTGFSLIALEKIEKRWRIVHDASM